MHSGLLHIEEGSPGVVEGKDSVLGKVHNYFGVDSCFDAMDDHEKMDLADSPGSTPVLAAALHSLNPVHSRRVDMGIGCRICPAGTALAGTGPARMQPVHAQTQSLQEERSNQKLEKAPGRLLEYHPYHHLRRPC